VNPALERLGFGPGDRVAVLHADDLGMCQATVAACAELADSGLPCCGSAMVPCPWFGAAADLARSRPALDLGVHLTLTSEWASYRWRPISTLDPGSGLLDEEGFLHRSRDAARRHARPAAAGAEMAAQLARALAAGVDVTHLDAHMYAALAPELLPRYARLALDHALPAFLWPAGSPHWESVAGWDGPDAVERAVAGLAGRGAPRFDHAAVMRLAGADRDDDLAAARRLVDALPAGLSCILLHPAVDGPELRAVAPDWPARVADFEVLRDPRLRRHLAAEGVHLLGYRALREAMRAAG
jgi:predicted glycoside hydrolase/deacetylase ChbG (UPF0249 family)